MTLLAAAGVVLTMSAVGPASAAECKHTDSHGDTYDLTGIPKVDGKWTTQDNRPAYYHIGICGPPTQNEDPTKGCPPACVPACTDPSVEHCECSNAKPNGMDIGGEAVCQFDGTPNDGKRDVLYNCGMEDKDDQSWTDGPEAGKSVELSYGGGSGRGGCGDVKRKTEIIVTCDPCKQSTISFVSEPSKCVYRVNISSYSGCPTNKPPPTANCPHICDEKTHTCKTVAPGTPGANTTLGECAKGCKKPAPKPPPPPPPAPKPLYTAPCIRVTNTIPTSHKVDIQIVQKASGLSFTWPGYGFGEFSNWTSHFKTGTGTVNVIDSKTQKLLLSIPNAPLTPGPLVVAVKCSDGSGAGKQCWPPSDKQLGGSVDTIAASFTPTKKPNSGVRIFNLSPNTFATTLTEGGKKITPQVAYGLGSEWVKVTSGKAVKLGALGNDYKSTIATTTVTPPAAPEVFTLWLIGNSTSYASDDGGEFAVRLVEKLDAPLGELCPVP